MKFIIGKKLEMTQIWQNDKVVAVTKVQAEPNTVVQVRTEERDGYKAVQLGFGTRKEKNINKAQIGHNKSLGNFAKVREFRFDSEELKTGDKISVNTFQVGDTVDVIGVSKGKGFQGVVKRHGFHGQDKTHGNKDQLRMPGSAGATGPAHVFKGMRMPGRMGADRVTMKNLEVVEIDLENNFLYIKGGVPGARNSLLLINGEGELKIEEAGEKKDEKKEEASADTVNTEDKKPANAQSSGVAKEEIKEEDKKAKA